MNGYSKIKIIGTTKSRRSMDFPDLSLAFPEPTKPDADTSLKPQEPKLQIINHDTATTQDSLSVLEEDQESNTEGRSSVKLKRNSSVSSTSSLQTTMKIAFSIRRSSSVSERYCRIHDQSVTLSSPIHDEDGSLDTMETTRSAKKKHGRGRILKACKKLFGL